MTSTDYFLEWYSGTVFYILYIILYIIYKYFVLLFWILGFWLLRLLWLLGFCLPWLLWFWLSSFGFMALLAFWLCYQTEEYSQQQPPTLTTSNNAKAMQKNMQTISFSTRPVWGAEHRFSCLNTANSMQKRQQTQQQGLVLLQQQQQKPTKEQQQGYIQILPTPWGGGAAPSPANPLPLSIFKALVPRVNNSNSCSKI